MLTQLYIQNIAVIEQASIDFEPGFTVLTGETGAGKSHHHRRNLRRAR